MKRRPRQGHALEPVERHLAPPPRTLNLRDANGMAASRSLTPWNTICVRNRSGRAISLRPRRPLAREGGHAAIDTLLRGAYQRGVSPEALTLAVGEPSSCREFPTIRAGVLKDDLAWGRGHEINRLAGLHSHGHAEKVGRAANAEQQAGHCGYAFYDIASPHNCRHRTASGKKGPTLQAGGQFCNGYQAESQGCCGNRLRSPPPSGPDTCLRTSCSGCTSLSGRRWPPVCPTRSRPSSRLPPRLDLIRPEAAVVGPGECRRTAPRTCSPMLQHD